MSGLSEIPPPGVALEQWLHFLRPPGALVWETLPAPMPWTKPPGGGSRRRPGDVELREVLSAAGVAKPAQDYVLKGPMVDLMVYSPGELQRNHGLAARAVQVAAEVDIGGAKLAEISSRLRFTDHLIAVPQGEGVKAVGDPRRARRYLSEGRRVLRALGVWPWVHVDDWRKARRWWGQPEVVAAAIHWHDEAWWVAAQKLAWSARARNGLTRIRSLTMAEARACLEFRETLRGLEPPMRREP